MTSFHAATPLSAPPSAPWRACHRRVEVGGQRGSAGRLAGRLRDAAACALGGGLVRRGLVAPAALLGGRVIRGGLLGGRVLRRPRGPRRPSRQPRAPRRPCRQPPSRPPPRPSPRRRRRAWPSSSSTACLRVAVVASPPPPPRLPARPACRQRARRGRLVAEPDRAATKSTHVRVLRLDRRRDREELLRARGMSLSLSNAMCPAWIATYSRSSPIGQLLEHRSARSSSAAHSPRSPWTWRSSVNAATTERIGAAPLRDRRRQRGVEELRAAVLVLEPLHPLERERAQRLDLRAVVGRAVRAARVMRLELVPAHAPSRAGSRR